MSVLCCTIPDFLVNLACRHEPGLAEQPLVLLTPDDRVCAISAPARQVGVQVGMRVQQAQTHCPDVRVRALAMEVCQAQQAAFVGVLAGWELPTEELSWGAAYLDLHALAGEAKQVQPLAAELGRQVRRGLGERFQPALGWDSGKFTARAAALRTLPGRMRLVGKADEVKFLAPLPITLLPLPQPTLQQLHWLGIRTLGQFASLPTVAVQERFGAAGKLAQRWAQGHDHRSVSPNVTTAPEPITLDLEAPTANLALVVATAMDALKPALEGLAERLEGCRRLQGELFFLDGSLRTVALAFVEPVSQLATVQAALTQQLRTLVWPADVIRVRLWLLAIGELHVEQLTLFPASETTQTTVNAAAQKLSSRYGSIFFQAGLTDATHPIPARRFELHALV